MRTSVLSVFTLLFMMYGTDCSAGNVDSKIRMYQDLVDNAEGDSANSSSDESYEKRRKEAKIKKGSLKELRNKFGKGVDEEVEQETNPESQVELSNSDSDEIYAKRSRKANFKALRAKFGKGVDEEIEETSNQNDFDNVWKSANKSNSYITKGKGKRKKKR